ncbi:tRNA pseudouridine synthase A-like protein, partial [Dinothrombium tinctorium]
MVLLASVCRTLLNQMQTNFKRQLKPKKFAILITYCGDGYFGIQRNKGVPTIEEEILTAFYKSGAITKECYDRPQAAAFQKASRTDKGVSAVRQILSCKLPPNFCELIPQINEFLPQKIRVVAAKKATQHFDSKRYCDGRTYSYMMPSYALCPPEEFVTESYRIKPEIIKKFNEILEFYNGTHNFHNFTSQKLPTDPSSMRYIVSVICGQPFIKDGIEFIIVEVKGQSFMMHQIRKMIGLAIAIMRGLTTEE